MTLMVVIRIKIVRKKQMPVANIKKNPGKPDQIQSRIQSGNGEKKKKFFLGNLFCTSGGLHQTTIKIIQYIDKRNQNELRRFLIIEFINIYFQKSQ